MEAPILSAFNPYRQLIPESDLERQVVAALVAAWWRGWDQAEASQKKAQV